MWDGTFGSLAAAIIGGLVALGVVRLTNRHQSRLASEARERAAIGDLVANAQRLVTEFTGGRLAIEHLLQGMLSATVRWQMETSSRDLMGEIDLWPHHLSTHALNAYEMERHGQDNRAAWDPLVEGVVALRGVALSWPEAKKSARQRAIDGLRLERERRPA